MSVGALGVITEVTLRCVPLFTLRGVDAPEPLGEVLDTLDERVDRRAALRVLRLPARRRRADADERRRRRPAAAAGRPARFAEDVLVNNAVLGAAVAAGRRAPQLIPALNRTIARGLTARAPASTAADRIFASPRLVRFIEME